MVTGRALRRHYSCFLVASLSLCVATALLAASEDALVPNTPEARALLPAGEAGYAILPLSPMLKLRPDQLPPDRPAGQDFPYPSLRLAVTRDGFEDYDLLRLLEERVRIIRADLALHDRLGPELLNRALGLLTTEPLVMSAGEYEHDPLPYEQRHREMLEVLADLAN